MTFLSVPVFICFSGECHKGSERDCRLPFSGKRRACSNQSLCFAVLYGSGRSWLNELCEGRAYRPGRLSSGSHGDTGDVL